MNTTKVCPECGRQFEAHEKRIYCTLTCRNNAKHHRRVARDAHLNQDTAPRIDTRLFTTQIAPTTKQLDTFAQLILTGTTEDKPILCTDVSVMWQPPQGIDFVKQQGEHNQWLMVKKEKSIFDLLATMSGEPPPFSTQ